MERIRILNVVSSLENQGPIRVLYDLSRRLNRDQVEGHVLTLSPERQHSLWRAFEEDGVPCASLNMGRSARPFEVMHALRNSTAIQGVDIIHSCCFRADVYTAFSKLRKPQVVTRHEMFFKQYAVVFGFSKGLVYELIHILALLRVRKIVAIGDSVFDTCPAYLRSKCVLIPNGIDTAIYEPCTTTEEKTKWRKQLGLPVGKTIFLFAGRFDAGKRPDFIIEAFKKMTKDACLILAGTGEREERCKERAAGCDDVIFLGFHKHLEGYMKACDVLVSASLSEGLPLSVLEALSCGLPVILSDIPSHRGIIRNDESVGVLFNKDDSAALTKQLDAYVNPERCRRDGLRARQVAVSRYDINVTSRAYLDVYMSCLNP